MSRSYTKRNEAYWESRKSGKPQQVIVNNLPPVAPAGPTIIPQPFPDVLYGNAEIITPHNKEAIASAGGPPTTFRGSQSNNGMSDPNAFQNIRAMGLPYAGYNGNRSYVGMRDAIDLCTRAWVGVPVVRNAIEVAVEFSCQPLYVKCENARVKAFFDEWIPAAQIAKTWRQGSREYYRGGNCFWYTFYGKFGPAYYSKMQSLGAKENKVPIRYELMNPTNVFVPTGLTFPYTYVRLLSTYEVERLKNPLTEQDKQVYQDLPKEVKDQLKVGQVFPLGVYIPMDAKRLRFMFYKKQDYEPLAVPMVWPVLPDVEWKLTLKKMDMELARKIEHAICLITTGEPPSQYNGGNGINQNNIARLQNLFTNQTLIRYLVADYSTKASWVMPDVEKTLGPEKYKIVNEDIKEGLQSILTGDDKFANAQMKAKVFIQRLEEGQQCFLEEFLMPEVKNICETMGFRTIPEIGFQKIDLQDEAVMARIVAQLAQIGVLTAEQAVSAIDTGVLPDAREMQSGQETYKKARDKGLYEPLVGGQKDEAGMNGRPAGTSGIKPKVKKVGPIGTSKAYSVKTYKDYLIASQNLSAEIEKVLLKKAKVKNLNDAQRSVVKTLIKTIIATQPKDKWIESIATTLEEPPLIPAEIAREIDDIQIEFDIDAFDAAILIHCKTEEPSE